MHNNSVRIVRTKQPSTPTLPRYLRKFTMADEEDIAALVIDNGSGMCKGTQIDP